MVNPIGIFGPVLGPDYSSLIQIIAMMLAGACGWRRRYGRRWSTCATSSTCTCAMTAPQADRQRYLALTGEPMSFHQIAATLRARLGAAAAKAPARAAPAWLFRLMARFLVLSPSMIPALALTRPIETGWRRASRVPG